MVEEVKNLTAQCKNTADNKTACYAELGNKLTEAETMNISTDVLEDSKVALREFEESTAGAQVIL